MRDRIQPFLYNTTMPSDLDTVGVAGFSPTSTFLIDGAPNYCDRGGTQPLHLQCIFGPDVRVCPSCP